MFFFGERSFARVAMRLRRSLPTLLASFALHAPNEWRFSPARSRPAVNVARSCPHGGKAIELDAQRFPRSSDASVVRVDARRRRACPVGLIRRRCSRRSLWSPRTVTRELACQARMPWGGRGAALRSIRPRSDVNGKRTGCDASRSGRLEGSGPTRYYGVLAASVRGSVASTATRSDCRTAPNRGP